MIGKQDKCIYITSILDVICHRFYFGEVQEDVLGQCSGQGISACISEDLSVHQQSVPEKTSRVVEDMPLKYSTEFSRVVLEILEKLKAIARAIP